MAESLEQGPIYFFDQLKTKRKWDKKKEPREQLGDFISGCTNPQESSSSYRNPGCIGEHMEGSDALVKSNITKQIPISPPRCDPLVFRKICEDPSDQPFHIFSHSLTEETLQSDSLDKFKCKAVTILQELEDMLRCFSKYKIILPQGILNIFNYSWKELVEDAWYNKKYCQGPRYRNVKLGGRQASEESSRLSPTSEYTDDDMAADIKRRSKKRVDFPTDVKGSENPGPLLNKPVVSQQGASDSSATISFSLSSKLCKEKGWVSQHSGSDTKDLEWKIPYIWAVERLQLAKIQMYLNGITEQLSQLKESGFDKPVILRHYGNTRKDIFGKTFHQNIRKYMRKRVSSDNLYEKPQLPGIKKNEPLLDCWFTYPSGHFAVCQSYSDLPNGGLYTNIFSDFPDCALLGTFTPSGHGSISFPNSNNIAMIFNKEGGMVTNKDGEILRQWKWPGAGKLDDPIIIQVNNYVTVRIAGRFAVSLIYKWEHETVNLSLSPVRGVALPRQEDLGQIFTEVKLLSKSIKAFTDTHSKTLKEKEENIPLKKEGTKIPQNLEENVNHMKDFSAMRELRMLRRKIKSILEEWMEYYRTAFEISSPRIHKTFLQRGGRQCKAQFVSVFLDAHTTQEEKNGDHQTSLSHNVSPFQSAYSHLTQDVSSGSSRAPQLLSSIFKRKQAFLSRFILNKDSPLKSSAKSFNSACPIALRRTMMGHETKTCRCSSYQIPYVTDLEYDHIINNQVSSPEQIIVVCVTASLGPQEPKTDEHLEQLYERKNKNRCMPCTQGRLDSFRLLRYDINSADEFTGHGGSLLVKRHNIGPGMFLVGSSYPFFTALHLHSHPVQFTCLFQLKSCQQETKVRHTPEPESKEMYIQGKLLFANYIFNGYSKSVKDLQKQIVLTRSNYNKCYYLPADYRFR
ncbi:hypothetical protein JD844_028129, partial [Phrynosoma platyrhinos]